MVLNDLVGLMKQGAILAVLAGIVAVALGFVFGAFPTDPLGVILASLLLLVIALFVFAKAGVDDLKVVPLILLFFAIGIVGSIVALIFPMASDFILTIDDPLSISGLLFTTVYIGIAQLGRKMLGI